jgi:glutamyl-tRNA synthetase
VAVSGAGVSPAIDITLSLLGREKTLARMSRAVEYIKEKNKG